MTIVLYIVFYKMFKGRIRHIVWKPKCSRIKKMVHSYSYVCVLDHCHTCGRA